MSVSHTSICTGFPSGIIRLNWNGTESRSVAPAQGWHAQVEKCKHCSMKAHQYHVQVVVAGAAVTKASL